MAKEISKTEKTADEKWCEISNSIELKDIRQISGTFKQTPEASIVKKTIDLQRDVKVEIDNENKMIFVVADFKLKAYSDEEKSCEVLEISASFLIAYKLDELKIFVDEDFKFFANNNGIYNAWPFWREYVQSASTRMGLPTITIPVFRIWPTKK